MKNRKKIILYCNPIFLDYRIPFYKELYDLLNGQFRVLYSSIRYKGRYDSMLRRIDSELDGIAKNFTGEHFLCVDSKKIDEIPSGNKGAIIPFTSGLLRSIRKIRPDVLITEGFYQWTPLVLFYGFIFNVPVFVGYERTLYTERNVSWLKTLHRKISNLFIKGYFVNGSETEKYLMSIGIPNSKIYLGGMSADATYMKSKISKMDHSETTQLRNSFLIGDGLVFLFSGYIIERKGVHYLLQAWVKHIAHYPNDRLVLVGGGDMLDILRSKYCNEKSIQFVGRVEYSNIYKYYSVADVFILPTLEDNWSLVVPEAMACGLPVATSIYNGCYSELIKEGINGFIFDTYNIESIVDVLSKFHFSDLHKMGKASIEMEEPFNVKNSAFRVAKVLNKLI